MPAQLEYRGDIGEIQGRYGASSGVITVVLPPPMIICSQLEPPPLAAATKLRTSVTWLG